MSKSTMLESVKTTLGNIHVDYDNNARQLRGKDTYSKNGERPAEEHTTLKGLATSIKKEGLLTPLLVVRVPEEERKKGAPEFDLVAGFRRMEAMTKVLGWDAATEVDVRIMLPPKKGESENDRECRRIVYNIVENTQRENLHAAELCEAFGELADMGMNGKQIAAATGASQSYVNNLLRLRSSLHSKIYKAFLARSTPKSVRELLELVSLSHDEQWERFTRTGGDDGDAGNGGDGVDGGGSGRGHGPKRPSPKKLEAKLEEARKLARDGYGNIAPAFLDGIIAALAWAYEPGAKDPMLGGAEDEG